MDLIAANRMQSAYVRPIVFRGAGGLGVIPSKGSPVDVSIMALEWGAYLGDAINDGADVCVSSWNRPAPNTIPSWAKAGGNYLSSQLIGFEAQRGGYAEGIALGTNGLLSEGAGENLFLVRKGRLYTPTTSAGILAGITRDTVITLAGDLGLEVEERDMPREALYTSDEVFMTGTAAEITPVRSVDRKPVGSRQARSDHAGPAEGLLRPVRRQHDRHAWLARTGLQRNVRSRTAASRTASRSGTNAAGRAPRRRRGRGMSRTHDHRQDLGCARGPRRNRRHAGHPLCRPASDPRSHHAAGVQRTASARTQGALPGARAGDARSFDADLAAGRGRQAPLRHSPRPKARSPGSSRTAANSASS